MDWGMILSPFLGRSPITAEEDGSHRFEVGVLLRVLQEELSGILVAASKVVGTPEFGSP